MKVALTGTPGTGKTTAVASLETDLETVGLNEVIRAEELTTGTDEDRNSLVADIGALEERLSDRDGILIESHLAHHFEADRIVVLRCHPEKLKRRLLERGETETKAAENAEAEAIDVILTEAVERHSRDSVYEIDTTDRSPDEVADEIERVLDGERQPTAGTIDFTAYL